MTEQMTTAPRNGDPLNGSTLPISYYTDPDIWHREQTKIFGHSWTYLGNAAALQKPGDRLTGMAGRVPIVVTYGRDDNLHALVNVCRHRMHTVTTDSSSGKLLQCGYHGWTYDLDGRLVSAPGSRAIAGFDKTANALCSASLTLVNDWIFVNPDPDAGSMHDSLTDCEDVVATIASRSSEYIFDGRTEYSVKANWKLFMENTGECYHCAAVHKSTFADCFATSPDSYRVTNYENAWAQHGDPRWPSAEGETPARGLDFMMLWPSTFIGVDDCCAFAGSAIPVSPNETRFVVDNWRNPVASDEEYDQRGKMYGDTFQEDLDAVEQVQIGVTSGAVARGTFMPIEHQVQDFSIKVFDALG